jgi:hypothetical protein
VSSPLQDVYASKPKVVIAVRRQTRVLTNAADLRDRLVREGLDAQLADFAGMTFKQQVRLPAVCLSWSIEEARPCLQKEQAGIESLFDMQNRTVDPYSTCQIGHLIPN